MEAKLNSVLKQGKWCWKLARSEDLVSTIQSRLPEVSLGAVDNPVWIVGRSGSFVCADTLNHLRQKKAIVSWYSLIWRYHAILKQAFIPWLSVNNRLTTGDRLLAWGFKGDASCVFCKGMTECRDHIYIYIFSLVGSII